MIINEILWDDDTINHIARHGVEPREVEEVCFKKFPYILRAKYDRYLALGKTCSGRYLTIIFESLGSGKAKITTARAMSNAERRLYQRR